MKFSRRLLALLICVLMIATALPVGIFAEETEAVVAESETSVEESTDPAEEIVRFCGVQKRLDSENSFRIVFGLDSLDYSSAGIKIDRLMGSDGWVVGNMDKTKTHQVYTSIQANGETISADEYNVKYFALVAITEINTEGAVRLTPYVEQVDGEVVYGESVVYAVDFVNGELILNDSKESFTQDFTNHVQGKATERKTYEQQTDDNIHIVWGGDGSRTTEAMDEEGWAKWVVTPVKGFRKDGDPNTRISDSSKALTFEDGTPAPLWTLSERLRFAKTIPQNLTPYVGKTLVLTAKIRVDEIGSFSWDKGEGSKSVETTWTVTKDDKTTEYTETFYDYKEDFTIEEITVTFGFYDERAYTPITGASNDVTLKADGQWVEISTSLDVTQKLLDSLKTVLDKDGNRYHSAVRPSISAGGSTYIKTAYFDEITCTVVPTVHECDTFEARTVQPSCTTDGFSGMYCPVCGKLEGEKTVIPTTGHNPAQNSDPCNKDTVCSVCSKVLREAGHNAEQNDDPCHKDTVCSVCKTVIRKAGHINMVYTDKKDPTISSDGYRKGSCTACGEIIDEFLPRGVLETFETMSAGKTTNFNTESAFATDSFEISNTFGGTLEAEADGNKYLKHSSGQNGIYIYDTSSDKALTGKIVEISFKYMWISGTNNGGFVIFHAIGEDNKSTQYRFNNAWGVNSVSNLRIGTTSGKDFKVLEKDQWNDVKVVVNTTTYEYKLWVGDQLSLETDYANNKIWYRAIDGTWSSIETSKVERCTINAKGKTLDNFYLFHNFSNTVYGLDDLKIAILDSMPTDTRPAQ